jgi:single-stranded-DNA-specific exonuclease
MIYCFQSVGKSVKGLNWEVISKLKAESSKLKADDIVNILLENRGLKTKRQKDEFLNPKKPQELTLSDFGIDPKSTKKAIRRIQRAIKNKEKVVVYGDYDADGICATAIMWEALYSAGADIAPYIPDRFTDGYGLNAESSLKSKA